MRILYIHQYFATPSGKTGTRSYEFARRWAKAGHKVVMLTTLAALCEADLKDSTGRFIKRMLIDGIDVRAINLPYSQKMGVIKRGLSFFGFALISSIYVLFCERPDIIYATSTPLTVGIPALIAKGLRRIRFVFEVRDQWPRIPIEMGIIKNPLLKRMLYGLEKRIYKSAAAVVALSPGMASGVKEVLGPIQKEILIASNSSDTQLFSPDIDGSQVRIQQDWQDKFLILHFGAMGRANGLDFLIDAAQSLRDLPEIHFVVVGQGSEKSHLRSKIKERALRNIEVLDAFSKKQMPQVVAACDVSTVIFSDFPILEHNSANKFFDSLSAGKPILLNYSGWQRELIENHECGFGCGQCDLDGYVTKLKYLYDHQDKLQGMGQNARKLAAEKFDRDMLANKVLSALKSV